MARTRQIKSIAELIALKPRILDVKEISFDCLAIITDNGVVFISASIHAYDDEPSINVIGENYGMFSSAFPPEKSLEFGLITKDEYATWVDKIYSERAKMKGKTADEKLSIVS